MEETLLDCITVTLDHNEENEIASGIVMTVVNALYGVTQVALSRPENCRVFTDEEYLNGVIGTHGPFIEFETDTGYVIDNVARIKCRAIGHRNATFTIYHFNDFRKCDCYR